MFRKARQLSKLVSYGKSYAGISPATFGPLRKAKYAMEAYNLPKNEKVNFQRVS